MRRHTSQRPLKSGVALSGLLLSLCVAVCLLQLHHPPTGCGASLSYDDAHSFDDASDSLRETRTIRVVEYTLASSALPGSLYINSHFLVQLRAQMTRTLLDFGFQAVPFQAPSHNPYPAFTYHHPSLDGAPEEDVVAALQYVCARAMLLGRPRLLLNNPDARVTLETPDYSAGFPQLAYTSGKVWILRDQRPDGSQHWNFATDGEGNVIRGTWHMTAVDFVTMVLA